MTPLPSMSPATSTGTQTAYIIGAPTGFQAASGRYRSTLRDLANDPSLGIVGSLGEDAEKLAVMTDDDVRRIKALAPGMVIEPNILYQHSGTTLDNFEPITLQANMQQRAVEIHASNASGEPLDSVTIYLIAEVGGGRKSGYKGSTDASGVCRFRIAEPTTRFPLLVLFPRVNYWSRVIEQVEIQSTFDVILKALPPTTPEVYDWGHACARMEDGAAGFGEHVRIGIVDTGVIKDHEDLRPSGGVNCVFNEDESLWHSDSDGHGSHCAGVVSALRNGYGLKGYAPESEIMSYRVFPSNGGGAAAFDILKAIKRAVEDGCDIISMSLGSPTPQTTLRSNIEFAHDRGVLCLAASGNEGSAVSFPAAFPNVFAVGAFGEFGVYPQDSYHREAESRIRSKDGRRFMARFSNFGNRVEFCAPGVAIRSTVPGGYLSLDGTSMACPHIAGLAALALASRPDLLTAPRDAERVERLVRLLRESAEVFGFGAQYEGAGFPRIDRLLGPVG